MASFAELPLHYRLAMAVYPWRVIDPVPWSPLRRPLHPSRLALVSSAGLYRRGVDEPFRRVRGGDSSVRWIPVATDPRALAVGQTSDAFDRAAIEADVNEAWPLDRLRELVDGGVIGSLNDRHVSFNGSITAPGRLVSYAAPEMAGQLVRDGVDAALFVPV